MSTNFSGFTDRLTSPDTGIEPALWLPLPHLLAQGGPVAIGDLTAVTGRTAPEIRAALAAVPDTAMARSLVDEILPAHLPRPRRAHADAPAEDPTGL